MILLLLLLLLPLPPVARNPSKVEDGLLPPSSPPVKVRHGDWTDRSRMGRVRPLPPLLRARCQHRWRKSSSSSSSLMVIRARS